MCVIHLTPTVKFLAPLVLLSLAACGTNRTVDSRYGPDPDRRISSNVVTAAQISSNPTISSVEALLVQLVPGVQYGNRADGSVGISIRGFSNGRRGLVSGPLVVVDGVPTGTRGSIGLNPRDVERIEVLKDGASLSAYGFRGADGVILIETKTRIH